MSLLNSAVPIGIRSSTSNRTTQMLTPTTRASLKSTRGLRDSNRYGEGNADDERQADPDTNAVFQLWPGRSELVAGDPELARQPEEAEGSESVDGEVTPCWQHQILNHVVDGGPGEKSGRSPTIPVASRWLHRLPPCLPFVSNLEALSRSQPRRAVSAYQPPAQIPTVLSLRPMRVLVLDNYDSFTYNLVQYLGELGAELTVVRNDELDAVSAVAKEPDRVVISPGPGRPEDAGYSIDWIHAFAEKAPILGVCLGHQAMVAAFGGVVDLAPRVMHGKTSSIRHDGEGVFTGLSNPFVATRYHSLAAVTMPDVLEPCAWSEDDVVQGLRHKSLPIHGVQFHPESVLTVDGMAMLKNFLTD